MDASYTIAVKKARNGVGICLSEYWQDKVIAVERSQTGLYMKLVIPGMSINILSAYAPQQGCSQEEKDLFWNQLESILTGIPEGEELIVAGDLNGHVGMDGEGIERWHGKLMIGMKNEEGERVLEMAQTYDLALLNTFFEKKEEHLITFKSGGNRSVIDYIAIRRNHLGKVRNCKVVPGESIAAQHKLLITDLAVMRKRERRRTRNARTNRWKLKEEGQEYIEKLVECIENKETRA